MDDSGYWNDVASKTGYSKPKSASPRSSIRAPSNKTYLPWHKPEPPQPEPKGDEDNWKFWKPMLTEFYHIVENPQRLPSILHPFVSKGPRYTPGRDSPSYTNVQVDFPDKYGVHRRIWLNVCRENMLVGAVAATLIGLGTRKPSIPSRMLSALSLTAPLKSANSLRGAQPFGAKSAISFCATLLGRMVTGGLFYDGVNRNLEQNSLEFKDETFNRLKNAGFAGAFCGYVFGIRGGLQYAWLSAILHSSLGMLAEAVPNPSRGPGGGPKHSEFLWLPPRGESEVADSD